MADTDVETVTLTISSEHGDEDTLTVPRDLAEALGEDDQSPPEVVGDLSLLSMANRVHHMVHHQEGDPDPGLAALEETTLDLFEERFGVTFAEATGHDH